MTIKTNVRLGDILDLFGSGGANLVPGTSEGTPCLRDVLRSALAAIGAAHADSAAFTAGKAKNRQDGQLSVKLDDHTVWVWSNADATAADADHIAPTDVGVGAGRWISLSFLTSANLALDIAVATTAAAGLQSAADKKFEDGLHAAKGANLADADAALVITGGTWRVLPAATLSADRTLTINTTGAVAGDQMTITRRDVSAHQLIIVNGGVGAGTLETLPNSKNGFVKLQYDGANWDLREVGVGA